MAPDFRKFTNNTNSKKGGVNPPSSFQDEGKGLIEKYFDENYKYFSKYSDLTSKAMLGIFKKKDYSREAINLEVERIKREKISELKNKYPGAFKDKDFSSSNIEDSSSGSIDTITQRALRNLKSEVSEKEGAVSVEAVKKLAELEYLEKHFNGLEERAIKTEKSIKFKKKPGSKDNVGIEKARKKDKFKKSKSSTKEQEEQGLKSQKDKSQKIELEKKLEESKSARNQTARDADIKAESGSDDETVDYYDDELKVSTDKKSFANNDERKADQSEIESAPIREFEEKYIDAENAKSQSEKGADFSAVKEDIRKTNPDIIDENERIKNIKDEDIKEFHEKRIADTEESRKKYGEAMKEIEGLAEKEGFKGLDIDKFGDYIGTNRFGFIKDPSDSSNLIKAEYDTLDNKKVAMGEKVLKNFDEWMQVDSIESKKSIQNILKHEAQHFEGPAKKSSDKSGEAVIKKTKEEGLKKLKGESAKEVQQIYEEEFSKFYGGRDTQGRGYEMQTELQKINENYENIDDFIDNQARTKLGVDIGDKGLDFMSKNPYIIKNVDNILPVQHYNFIKPELKKKVVFRLEEMREDLADKYEIKQNKDKLIVAERVLKDTSSGSLDLAKKVQDNANAKINFHKENLDLRNEYRRLIKDETERTGKSKEDVLLSMGENKEYQKIKLLDKLNKINANIADLEFRDDTEKIKEYENEKQRLVNEYKKSGVAEQKAQEKEILEMPSGNTEDLRERIGRTLSDLHNINKSEESVFGKISGIEGISSHFELTVQAYKKDIENDEELKNIIESTRQLLAKSIKNKIEGIEKISQGHISSISTPAPVSPSAPRTPSHVSAPAQSSVPASSFMFSPQTPSPSQGGGKSMGIQSAKSGVSKPAPSSKGSSSAPVSVSPASSSAHTISSTPASQVAPKTPANAPLAQHQGGSSAPQQTSPQAPIESAPTSPPASHVQHQDSSARTSQAQPVAGHPGEEKSTEPAMQMIPATQNIGEPASQASPSQNSNISPDSLRQAPSANLSSQTDNKTPLSQFASPQSSSDPSQIPSQSQSEEEQSAGNAPEENSEEMTKEKIEKIKDAVREKLEKELKKAKLEEAFDKGSLEKNIDNGIGRGAVQDSAGKSDASGSDIIKNIAKKESNQEKYNRIKKDAERIKNMPQNIKQNVKDKVDQARKMREEFKEKSFQDFKKNLKKDIKKKIAIKKEALKNGLKKRLRDKAAKKGKSLYMSCLFMIMMFLAFVNDVVLDMFVALTIQTVGLIVSLTGLGVTVGLPAIAAVEAIGDIVDAATGVILVAFSLAIGGATKSGNKKIAKKTIKTLIKYGLAVVIELIPVINLFTSWMAIVAWDWYEVRRDADKANAEEE